MLGFLFKSHRRRQLLAQPLPSEWLQFIEQNVGVYRLLAPDQRKRLVNAARLIVAERSFVGCGGLVVTDEIKLTIAAEAALLLLGEEGYYFDRVPTVFVYPQFQRITGGRDLHGARLVEEGVAVEGQVLEQGEIRLAWDDVLFGSRDPADGENVVLHEFAHHLDRLDGEIGGTPPLASSADRRRWTETFDHELENLRADVKAGHEVFLHEAASENRAELFAYATECFFEQPLDLAEFHPELFVCLHGFYKVDPRVWFRGN